MTKVLGDAHPKKVVTPKWIVDESYECKECSRLVMNTRVVGRPDGYKELCECLTNTRNKDD